MKIICRLLGHRWVTLWSPDAGSATYAAIACTRCHTTAYRTWRAA